MNEVQLIQSQLALERTHALQIAGECAAAAAGEPASAGEFRRACAEYLSRVLGWFEERDARLAALAQSLPEGDATPALGESGRSREALELLAAARTDGDWTALAAFLRASWSQRREALEHWLASYARIPHWRVVSGLTADVILKERELYARTRTLRPSGGGSAARSPDLHRGNS